MNIGVILAGGIGSRFKSDIPKQYMKLNGQELIIHSINACRNAKKIDKFFIVVDSKEYENENIKVKYGVDTVLGGDSRNESIYNALKHIELNYPGCERVIFHDSARPFIKSYILDEFIEELDNYDAVITAVKITDSIGSRNKWVENRDDYYLIQAPEAFHVKKLLKHFSPSSAITSIVQQLPADTNVKLYYDFKNNLKITYPEDLFLAEQLIKLSYFRREENKFDYNQMGKVLVFGGSGGIGRELLKLFDSNNVDYRAPSSAEINLENLSTEKINEYLDGFVPDVVINLAATSISDQDGILENFDKVFSINLKANLQIIEYAQSLNKRVNLVLFSSSSSTKGRENITLYSASKVALNSVIESLANKMQDKNIYINGIIPEKINTPMIDKLHKAAINPDEMLDVEEVLDAILTCTITDEYGQLMHIRKGL